MRDVDPHVARAVQEQRRHADRAEHVADVEPAVELAAAAASPGPSAIRWTRPSHSRMAGSPPCDGAKREKIEPSPHCSTMSRIDSARSSALQPIG